MHKRSIRNWAATLPTRLVAQNLTFFLVYDAVTEHSMLQGCLQLMQAMTGC
jgi:hypothetical protein